jgi:hypothetical protein
MTSTEINAATFGAALGKRRSEARLVTDRAAVVAGFDKAVYAVVELALAGGWTLADADQFWQAYEAQQDDEQPSWAPLWAQYLDQPLGIAR